MKIKMLLTTVRRGPTRAMFVGNLDEIHDLPDAFAEELIAEGRAELAADDEAAAAAPKPKGKPGRKPAKKDAAPAATTTPAPPAVEVPAAAPVTGDEAPAA